MSSTLDVHWHPDVLAHDTGAGLFDAADPGWLAVPETHAENADRVRNMYSALHDGPYAGHLRWRDGRHATVDELALAARSRLHRGGARELRDGRWWTRTTLTAPGSWPALTAAAGTAIGACDAVLDGDAALAYALVRPPGHHAQPHGRRLLLLQQHRPGGRERAPPRHRAGRDPGLGRAPRQRHADAVLRARRRADGLLAHGARQLGREPPRDGRADETGAGAGEGFNVNVELPLGSGDHAYRTTFDEIVAPIVTAFDPGMIIIASGQDANQYDPNARQCVTMEGFRGLGERARALADRHTGGQLLLVQEGGYSRTYSAACLLATVEGVLGLEETLPDPLAFLPDPPGHAAAAIDDIRAVQARYWEVLR